MTKERKPADQGTPGSDPTRQAADDNRSRQLNEQDPGFHQSRGESKDDSSELAREATQENQRKQ
jgi:hypothetical protein